MIELAILLSALLNGVICIIMMRVTSEPQVYFAIGVINTIIGLVILIILQIARYYARASSNSD